MSKGSSGLFRIRTTPPTPDFYVSPNGKALPAKYKKWIGVSKREKLLRKVRDNCLKNAIDQMFRPGSFIGDGGTASVIKFEKRTGLNLGKNGNTHMQKGREMVSYLKKKILTQPSLSKSDRKIATKLVKSLLKAIGE